MRVSVIIPTRNEASALAHVLAGLRAGLVTEVLVVDRNSTMERPTSACAWVSARVTMEPRSGYGPGCLTRIGHCSSPDVIASLDDDYSDRLAELPDLLPPIAEGRVDITIGRSLAGRCWRRAMARHAACGNRRAPDPHSLPAGDQRQA